MSASSGPRLAPAEAEPAPAASASIARTPFGDEVLLVRIPSEQSLAERTARLTPSERAVVALAVAGRSNDAIAAERRSSPRTIANQLAAAYEKLGLSGRRELRARLRGRRPP
jgi:DNA-binding NarL/FixJ family response regulator